MQVVALLRGGMPSGKNKIPKMAYVVEILEEAGFKNVSTYIQSGNVLLESELTYEEIAKEVHNIIYNKIGAELSVIVKSKEEFQIAIRENPFNDNYDYSRIHLVFTNDLVDENKLNKIKEINFQEEKFYNGSQCLYMYLPKDASKKKLNNNFIEKKLGIVATMRKLNVVEHLYNRM